MCPHMKMLKRSKRVMNSRHEILKCPRPSVSLCTPYLLIWPQSRWLAVSRLYPPPPLSWEEGGGGGGGGVVKCVGCGGGGVGDWMRYTDMDRKQCRFDLGIFCCWFLFGVCSPTED